jgi:hypothetical protein
VAGRTNVDRAVRLAGNAIDEAELHNFGATHHTDSGDARVAALAVRGSVLHFPGTARRVNAASGEWHTLYNDVWILGAIHAHLEVHLASPRTAANIWTPHGLTVTGRELTGLKAAGYEIVKAPNGAEVVQCRDTARADGMTLERYLTAITDMTTRDGAPLIDPAARAMAWVHPRELQAARDKLAALGIQARPGLLPSSTGDAADPLDPLLAAHEAALQEARGASLQVDGDAAEQNRLRVLVDLADQLLRRLPVEGTGRLDRLARDVVYHLEQAVRAPRRTKWE